jgi:hypothetical protein
MRAGTVMCVIHKPFLITNFRSNIFLGKSLVIYLVREIHRAGAPMIAVLK